MLLALALSALGWHISKREDSLLKNSETKLPFYSWEIITSILIFAAILGIRWHTGYDHEMYLYEYSRLQNGLDCTREFEPGFLLIGKVFAKLGIHYSIYFAFWAALQIGGVYFALRDRKYLLPWVGILIVTGPYMLNWVNSMRQATVACLFLGAMPLIINKRFWLYALFVLLCATIHKSALLLLPVYFVPWIKPCKLFKGRYAHYAILGCCILLGLY
ncbi:MAG: EpsG family protein, partial [Muribaculaceae bacterium]|nr:EpsG family protein [Muribaculaceae bacterium]